MRRLMQMAALLLGGLLAGPATVADDNVGVAGEPAAQEENMQATGAPQVPAGKAQHPICWLEIVTADVTKSQAFYSELFGWRIEAMGDFVMFFPADGVCGNFKTDAEPGTQGSIPHIYADDMPAVLEAVVARGGEIAEPLRMLGEKEATAMFRDASGTLYGLVNAAPQLPVPHFPQIFGPEPKPPAGSVCSLELYGGDFAATRELFGNCFGWGLLDTMPQYLMFDPGAGIGGVFQSHTAVTKSVAYIWVEDVGATLTAIEAAGGKRMSEPMSVPGYGTFGYFFDPAGTAMGLIGPES
jgi:predicted enzyme related to lactoylglutathione lyase